MRGFDELYVLYGDVVPAQCHNIVFTTAPNQKLFQRMHMGRVEHLNTRIAKRLGVGFISQQIVRHKGDPTADISQYAQ